MQRVSVPILNIKDSLTPQRPAPTPGPQSMKFVEHTTERNTRLGGQGEGGRAGTQWCVRFQAWS